MNWKFWKKKDKKDDLNNESSVAQAGVYKNLKEYLILNEDALERVKKEYTFYKNGFEKSIKIILILAVAFGVYVSVDLYKVATNKETIETFFVTNQNNQIIPIKPVSQAFPDSDVTNWATESIIDIYTVGPLDFRKHITVDIQKYFMPESLKQYRQVIAPRIENITQNVMSMTATPAGSPVIINKGLLDNRYYWQVMLPVQLIYVSKGEKYIELRRVVMNIVRADVTRYPSGLAFTAIDESEPINSQKTN